MKKFISLFTMLALLISICTAVPISVSAEEQRETTDLSAYLTENIYRNGYIGEEPTQFSPTVAKITSFDEISDVTICSEYPENFFDNSFLLVVNWWEPQLVRTYNVTSLTAEDNNIVIELSEFFVDGEYPDTIDYYCAVIELPKTYSDYNFSVSTNDLIRIYTAEQLKAFADDVNSGNTYEGKTVVLCNDIDLSSICGATMGETDMTVSWTPIGASDNLFEGTFDGRGHTVSGLYINSEYMDLAGLFGFCTENSQILNVTVDGSITVGFPDDGYWANPPSSIGGIAGMSAGKIINCHNKAAITGIGNGVYAAGICGNGVSVENCINSGAVKSDGTSEAMTASGSGENCKNCYHLEGTSVYGSGAQAKTAEQFASGEVAYLLGEAWGQEIGVDKYPVIGGDTVYLVNGEYTNTPPQEKTYLYQITGLRFTDVSGNEIIAPKQGKSFIVEADIVKTEERSEKDYLFVAVYDESGALMSLDYVKAKFPLNDECSFGFNIPAQDKAVGSVKAFVWNTFDSAQPLAEGKILAPVVFE